MPTAADVGALALTGGTLSSNKLHLDGTTGEAILEASGVDIGFSLYPDKTDAHATVVVGTAFTAPFIRFAVAGGDTAGDTTLLRMDAGVFGSSSGGTGHFQGGHIQTIEAQTGTGYTMASAAKGKQITRNNGSASTMVWPTPTSLGITAGTRVHVTNIGAGTITHSADTGATVSGVTTQPQYEEVTALATSTTAWILTTGARGDNKVSGLNGATGLWIGTQAAYDALGSWPATVLYVIT
jgi:hypothetical protein